MTTQDAVMLWRAVISQAFRDATFESGRAIREQLPGESDKRYRDRCYNTSRGMREDFRAVRDAREWLLHAGGDFCNVCEYAGYDPQWVWGFAKRLEANQWRL